SQAFLTHPAHVPRISAFAGPTEWRVIRREWIKIPIHLPKTKSAPDARTRLSLALELGPRPSHQARRDGQENDQQNPRGEVALHHGNVAEEVAHGAKRADPED